MSSLWKKREYSGVRLVSTAEKGKQADEDIDDVEVDVESTVDGIVDGLGIDLRPCNIVADIGGEEDDEKPVECRASVVEEEGGDQFGNDAYQQGNE